MTGHLPCQAALAVQKGKLVITGSIVVIMLQYLLNLPQGHPLVHYLAKGLSPCMCDGETPLYCVDCFRSEKMLPAPFRLLLLLLKGKGL